MMNHRCIGGELLLFGGYANNGSNCGLVYANSNNGWSNSNSNIGARTTSMRDFTHLSGRGIVYIPEPDQRYKMIVNSMPIKQKLSHWWDNGITSIDTVFVDRGGKHYDIDIDKTSVISINNREICLDEKGNAIYKDNNEQVNI